MANERLEYLTGVKAAVVTSLRECFIEGFNGTVGIEYPLQKGDYPYIMVEFEQTKLSNIGIGHEEHSQDELDPAKAVTTKRWTFAGSLKFSLFSLRAKERDELFDAVLSAVGVSDEFKIKMGENEFIAMAVDTQTVEPGPQANSTGTPWGTDDLVYYMTMGFNVLGEFTSDVSTGGIISRVIAYPRTSDMPDLPNNDEGLWS